jgi:hypothetical protein
MIANCADSRTQFLFTTNLALPIAAEWAYTSPRGREKSDSSGQDRRPKKRARGGFPTAGKSGAQDTGPRGVG